MESKIFSTRIRHQQSSQAHSSKAFSPSTTKSWVTIKLTHSTSYKAKHCNSKINCKCWGNNLRDIWATHETTNTLRSTIHCEMLPISFCVLINEWKLIVKLQSILRVQLAKSMFYCRLIMGQTIIKQGDGASSFFVLEKGKINVLVDGIQRKQLTQG